MCVNQHKVLILFVHGFLGSETSFQAFPLDLLHALRVHSHIAHLEARVVPRFESKGNVEHAVNSLHNWLLLNASKPQYEGVILICHSMGGLIAADAIRKLKESSDEATRKSRASDDAIRKLRASDDDANRKPRVSSSDDAIRKSNISSMEDPKDRLKSEANKGSWTDGWWTTAKPTGVSSDKLSTVEVGTQSSSENLNTLDVNDQSSEEALEELNPQEFDIETSQKGCLKTQDVSNQSKDSSWVHAGAQHTEGGHMRTTIDNHVNVISLICFDSPFFGLNSTIFTVAAGNQASEIMDSYFPVDSAPRQLMATIGNGIQAVPSTLVSGVQYGSSAISDFASSTYSTTSDIICATPSVLYQAPSVIYSNLPDVSQYLPSFNYTTLSSTQEYGVPESVQTIVNDDDVVAHSESEPLIPVHTFADFQPGSVPLKAQGGHGEPVTHIVQSDLDITLETSHVLQYPDNLIIIHENSPSEIGGHADIATESIDVLEVSTVSHPSQLLPTSEISIFPSAISLGITTALIAGGAYYTGGLMAIGSMTVVRRIVVAYALSHANQAHQHIRFLYPVWGESESEATIRMETLFNLMENGFSFKCFFIQLGHVSRSFIRQAPDKYRYLFQPVGSDYNDEIAAHMGMFSRLENAKHYWPLVDSTAQEVRRSIQTLRHEDKP